MQRRPGQLHPEDLAEYPIDRQIQTHYEFKEHTDITQVAHHHIG